MANRIVWIDAAKAIGIYSVICGHCLDPVSPIEGLMRNFIYVFHMPLFFFLSGFLFKVGGEGNLLKKSAYSLLVPYVFLNAVAFVLWFPIYIHGNHDLRLQFIRFLIGESHAPAGPAWFLLCLFWVRLLACLVTKLPSFLQVLCVFGSCCLAYYFPYRLYWCIDSAFMSFPFFMAGFFSKRVSASCIIKTRAVELYYLCAFAALFMTTVIISWVQGNTDINYRIMGAYPILYYPCALIGVLMIGTGCKLVKGNHKLINIFASGSIIVMALHGCFVSYINFPLSFFLSEEIIKHWTYPIVLSGVALLSMYYPILFIQKYFSSFIGGR